MLCWLFLWVYGNMKRGYRSVLEEHALHALGFGFNLQYLWLKYLCSKRLSVTSSVTLALRISPRLHHFCQGKLIPLTLAMQHCDPAPADEFQCSAPFYDFSV